MSDIINDLTNVGSINSSMKQIIMTLKNGSNKITNQIIKDLIVCTKKRRKEQVDDYLSYTGKALKIDKKEQKRKDGINNKIKNDFRGDIVDTLQGYVFGEPIIYKANIPGNDEKSKEMQKTIRHINYINDFPDLDSETGKNAGICGFGAREAFIDNTNTDIHLVDVPPWECIFVIDPTLSGEQFALRLYKIEIKEPDGNFSKRWRVHWYDSEKITVYVQNDRGDFILDSSVDVNPYPHLLNGIPLFKFKNNKEELSDFKKVESLINGYDMVLSYNQDETEALRNAYLLLIGVELDPDDAEQVKETGTMEIPKDGEAKFITKDINGEFNENHLYRLEKNIYKFSKVPNFLDKEFQTSSGIALKYRLLPLENKAISKERKFSNALKYQFNLISDYLNKKQMFFDPKSITFTYTRNLPIDIGSEAEATTKLKGMVSEETRLSQLSFVIDPKLEIEKMKEDAKSFPNLDEIQ